MSENNNRVFCIFCRQRVDKNLAVPLKSINSEDEGWACAYHHQVNTILDKALGRIKIEYLANDIRIDLYLRELNESAVYAKYRILYHEEMLKSAVILAGEMGHFKNQEEVQDAIARSVFHRF